MKTKQKAIRRNQPYLDPYLDGDQMDVASATLKRKNPVSQDTTSNACSGNVSKKFCQRQGIPGEKKLSKVMDLLRLYVVCKQTLPVVEDVSLCFALIVAAEIDVTSSSRLTVPLPGGGLGVSDSYCRICRKGCSTHTYIRAAFSQTKPSDQSVYQIQ
ncbi:hypothetical protein CTI12_AA564460 [Artemisia annua]|uniref:Uncharacterized protein n=1 Tax=Artemisia annua TaxID=35608 RepID=A0A2U1KT39_ARTAN|nr:hypothetical protein CTI12_AA564460 [Artemisia annua]